MVGEHDWFYDMGDTWQEMFGPPNYSFDWKGVHVVVLMSVHEKDFWTARKMTPARADANRRRARQRHPVALRSRRRRARVARRTTSQRCRIPRRCWSSRIRRSTNITATGISGPRMPSRCRRFCKPYQHVTVIHGHTHQMLLNQIGNISFYGMLSTAWPWPYAPQGLPPLTMQMNRADPFDQFDGMRRRPVQRPRRRAGGQNLQPVGSQSGHREGDYLISHGKTAGRRRRSSRAIEAAHRNEAFMTRRSITLATVAAKRRGTHRRSRSRRAHCARSTARRCQLINWRVQRRRRSRDALRRRDQHGSEGAQAGPADDARAGARRDARLMAEWQRKHPGRALADRRKISPPPLRPNRLRHPPPHPQRQQSSRRRCKAAVHAMQQGDTYASFNERDYKVWKAKTDSFVAAGQENFPRRQGTRRHHRRSVATCAIPTPPTRIPRPIRNTRSSYSAWRCCAT